MPNNAAVLLEGKNNLIRDSQVSHAAGHAIVLNGSNSRAENNVVHNFAYMGGGAAGIRTFGAGHLVDKNTVYRGGREGIKINNTTRVRVLSNRIFDVMLQTQDGGGIYSFGMNGAGSEIAYNVIYNVRTGGWGGCGIMLDAGSDNYLIHHNATWNVNHGMKLNSPARGNKVYNNTFVGTDTAVGSHGSRNMTGTVFKNNIFTGKTEIGGGARQENNLYPGTDFRFVNPSQGNFQLRADSPALDRGQAVAPYTNGFAGRAPDIGAYEYGRSVFFAGSTFSGPFWPPVTPTGPAPTPRPTPGTDPGPQPTPDPTPDPTPTPDPDPTPGAARDARVTIQGESFDSARGATRGSTVVGQLDTDDWVRYANLDFGTGVNRIKINLAAANKYAGRVIDIRVGGPAGTLAGTMVTRGTGGWGRYTTQTAPVSGLSGVQDVYLVVRRGPGGNIDSFTFDSTSAGGGTPAPAPTPTPKPKPTPGGTAGAKRNARRVIQAEHFDATSGAVRGGASIGHLDDGDWVKYSKVDFGSGVSRINVHLAAPAAADGKPIEVRLGGAGGRLVGTLVTEQTGGWSKFKTQSASVSGATGVQDLYLVFPDGPAGNVDRFTFA
jgi:hypothetical protein